MSSVSKNQMGPVKDVVPKIAEIVSTREIKHAAIHALHEKHRENKMHKFVEDNFQGHVQVGGAPSGDHIDSSANL